MKAEEIRKRAEAKEGRISKFPLPEWDVTIHHMPVTVADEEYLIQKFKDLPEAEQQSAYSVELIMLKALDEDGNRIWTTEEHRNFLRGKVRNLTVLKLVARLSAATIEDKKKR